MLPRADEQRADRHIHGPLLSRASWSHLRAPGPGGLCMTFWGQNREHRVPSGCSCAVPLEMSDAPGLFPLPPVGGLNHLLVLNATYRAMPPHSNTQQLLRGATEPSQGSGPPGGPCTGPRRLRPGNQPAVPVAGWQKARPRVPASALPSGNTALTAWGGGSWALACLEHDPLTSGRRAACAQGPPGPGWAHSRRCPPCR